MLLRQPVHNDVGSLHLDLCAQNIMCEPCPSNVVWIEWGLIAWEVVSSCWPGCWWPSLPSREDVAMTKGSVPLVRVDDI